MARTVTCPYDHHAVELKKGGGGGGGLVVKALVDDGVIRWI